MSLRHVAALALVGWYLMMPPTQKDLDRSCGQRALVSANGPDKGTPSLWDYGSLIVASMRGEQHINVYTVHERRCETEETTVEADAPLSQWIQMGEFEKLTECEDRYSSFSATPPPDEDREDRQSMAEIMGRLWGKDASYMANAKLDAGRDQGLSATCIASDDPRLKGGTP
jgi:hypothetical protein